jgi:hypothetical protein
MDEQFEKKIALLGYLLNELENKKISEEVKEKTIDELKKIDVYINVSEEEKNNNIIVNELALNFCSNLKNILEDCYLIEKDGKIKIPNVKTCRYADHIDYWSEPIFLLDELPCGDGRGICEFENDFNRIINPEKVEKFRLKKFKERNKCIYCILKFIERQFKINRFLENFIDVIYLNLFVYMYDIDNEYPSERMLTQYENPDYFGLSGKGGIPKIDISTLKIHFYNKMINNNKISVKYALETFFKTS